MHKHTANGIDGKGIKNLKIVTNIIPRCKLWNTYYSNDSNVLLLIAITILIFHSKFLTLLFQSATVSKTIQNLQQHVKVCWNYRKQLHTPGLYPLQYLKNIFLGSGNSKCLEKWIYWWFRQLQCTRHINIIYNYY